MRKRRAARATALAVSALMILSCCYPGVAARPQTSYMPYSGPITPIVVSTPTPSPTVRPKPSKRPEKIPQAVAEKTPAPTRSQAHRRADSGSGRVAGSATWYCCTRGYGSGGLIAAAGSELRIGNWRGRVVTVTGPGGNSIRVTLRDWCLCRGNRIIDLHPGAFARLAPLSRGVIPVTVRY